MTKRILQRAELLPVLEAVRQAGGRIVFTNGCFDLLHVGHLRYLSEARALGHCLVVALNTDESVVRIKGPDRPIVPEMERAEVVAALEMVDYVTFFDDPTPQEIIEEILPDVLVKGADWPIDSIVGRDVVWARGGQVINVPVTEGYSTTKIISKMLQD